LLTDVDQSYSILKTDLKTGGEANIFTGKFGGDFSVGYYQAHKNDMFHFVEEELKKSSSSTTSVSYPEALISGIVHCNEVCGRNSLLCEAVAVSTNTVELMVNYQPPSGSPPVSTFEPLNLPNGVVNKSKRFFEQLMPARKLENGSNLFELDRSGHPESFALTVRTSQAGSCYATAPAANMPVKPTFNNQTSACREWTSTFFDPAKTGWDLEIARQLNLTHPPIDRVFATTAVSNHIDLHVWWCTKPNTPTGPTWTVESYISNKGGFPNQLSDVYPDGEVRPIGFFDPGSNVSKTGTLWFLRPTLTK